MSREELNRRLPFILACYFDVPIRHKTKNLVGVSPGYLTSEHFKVDQWEIDDEFTRFVDAKLMEIKNAARLIF